MIKVVRTADVLEAFNQCESAFGPGYITSTETRDSEYIVRLVDNKGNPHVLRIPIIEKQTALDN